MFAIGVSPKFYDHFWTFADSMAKLGPWCWKIHVVFCLHWQSVDRTQTQSGQWQRLWFISTCWVSLSFWGTGKLKPVSKAWTAPRLRAPPPRRFDTKRGWPRPATQVTCFLFEENRNQVLIFQPQPLGFSFLEHVEHLRGTEHSFRLLVWGQRLTAIPIAWKHPYRHSLSLYLNNFKRKASTPRF